MDEFFLRGYLEREKSFCSDVFQNQTWKTTAVRDKLRALYGICPNDDVVYCESGGIENLDNFPSETRIVVPVFPYKTQRHFEKHLGPLDVFLSQCGEGQRIPPCQ